MNEPVQRSPRRYHVGAPGDVPPGQRRIVDVPPLGEVGIFNIRGEYFAVKNVCPHMGGPMCRGRLTGTTQARFEPGRPPQPEWVHDGEILRCPWHGWEFDIRTGKAMFSERTQIVTYDVRVMAEEGADAPADDGSVPTDAETYPIHVEAQRLMLEVPERRRSRDALTTVEETSNAH